MEFQPLVSVIIPTHNAAATLRTALESVVNQTYPKVEIIVVDYQSTDATKEIVASYSSVRFVSETEKGIYQAMNTGIAQANGEWIYFLGADDYLYNELVFKELFEQKIPENTQLILGKVENIGAKHSLVPTIYQNTFSSGLYWRNTLHHQGILYHTSIFEQYQYNTKYKILADYELNLRLFLANTKAYHSQLFIAKSFAGGISKQFTHALYDEELAFKNELLPIFPKILNWLVIKGKRWVKVKGE
jgi:putative colanic acid biosynthesis glycosyltransferase